MCTSGHTFKKVHRSIICISQNLNTIQISINRKWINKLWDTYSVKIFHCNENEWTTAGNTTVVQSQSCVWLFETPCTAAHQASLSFTIFQSLLKLMSIDSMMPSNHLILGHPLLLLPSVFSSFRIFSNESALHIRWLKYWNFSFSISLSNEYSGLIFFMIDWLVLLPVSETLKSLLQHHNLKASVLQHSAFFMVQLSHLDLTTGKTIALTAWNFVGKVMSLLVNTQSRFVIAFLPRSKCLLNLILKNLILSSLSTSNV